jgi:hypothetical protein
MKLLVTEEDVQYVLDNPIRGGRGAAAEGIAALVAERYAERERETNSEQAEAFRIAGEECDRQWAEREQKLLTVLREKGQSPDMPRDEVLAALDEIDLMLVEAFELLKVAGFGNRERSLRRDAWIDKAASLTGARAK